MNDAVVSHNNQELDRRILSEQVALMCGLTTLPLLGSIFVGAIIAYVAIDDAGLLTSGLWYAAAVVIMIVRWRVAVAYLRRPRSPVEVTQWRNAMFVLLGMFGAIWSIPTAFLLPTVPEKEIVMSVMFIAATATGIGSLAPVRHAYAVLLVPFAVPYGVTQFLMGGDRVLIGSAVLLYIPVMIAMANRQSSSIERQLRLGIENEALVGALRHERDRANESNRVLQGQLEQQRQSVERIHRLNSELERQALELRTANQDLEGFSYTVSHDLRAPLRAIDGFSHLLQENGHAKDPHECEHYMHRIRENVTRMSLLIDDLLAFARCGRQAVEMVELRMDELVREAVREALATHRAKFAPEIAIADLPRARGDQSLMLQVWVNLIDNAVKYSGKVPTPKIIVSGREEPDRIVYEVIDNGAGFDSRYSERLFGVFQRLHGNDYPGAGVGLAIVHRIVTRHGGEVWAKSEVNQGAAFGFALPKAVREGVDDRESESGLSPL